MSATSSQKPGVRPSHLPLLPLYQLFEDQAHQYILVDYLKQLLHPQISHIPKPAKKAKSDASKATSQAPSDLGLSKSCQIRLNILILMNGQIERAAEQQCLLKALRSLKQLLTSDGDALQQRDNAQFVIDDCPEVISILNLLLIVAHDQPVPHVDVDATLRELRTEAITVLLALSFCQSKSADSPNFAQIMSQR